jgi:dihydroneopterin aldolase
MPQDRLSILGMTFHAHHGLEEHEIEFGQRFDVDVEMLLDTSKAAATDHLRDTVDVRQVYKDINKIVMTQRFYLIEALSQKVATVMLEQYQNINQVTVRVRKPVAPLGGLTNGTQIEITRSRM